MNGFHFKTPLMNGCLHDLSVARNSILWPELSVKVIGLPTSPFISFRAPYTHACVRTHILINILSASISCVLICMCKYLCICTNKPILLHISTALHTYRLTVVTETNLFLKIHRIGNLYNFSML